MARGGPRAGTGPIPKLNADGTRVNPVRKAALDGPPKKRGRPSNAERAARLAAMGISAPGGAGLGDPALPLAAPVLPKPAPGVAPPTLYTPEMPPDISPKDYFLTLMRDPKVSAERRDRAAQVAISYVDVKPGEAKLGKKEQRQVNADALTKTGGKFSAGRPPLSAVN